jgi:hypothetical protein
VEGDGQRLDEGAELQGDFWWQPVSRVSRGLLAPERSRLTCGTTWPGVKSAPGECPGHGGRPWRSS